MQGLRGIGAIICAILIAGCSTTTGPGSSPSSAATSAPTIAPVLQSASPTSGLTIIPSQTPTAEPTPSPTPSPTPTPEPTAVPTPEPTATPRPITGVYGNPWGYDFKAGTKIFDPPLAFCDYFPCIPSFWTSTNGYVVQCKDLDLSHSGGRSGVCSYHGGYYRTLYQH